MNNYFKITASLITLILLTYLVGGYITLSWFLKGVTSHELYLPQESLLEKKMTNAQAQKKLHKKDNTILEPATNNITETPKENRGESALTTPDRLQQIRDIDRLMTFADNIVKNSAAFNPCASICNESTLRLPESDDLGQNRMEWLMTQYELSEEQTLKDPKINQILLSISNIRMIVDTEIMESLIEILEKDTATLASDPIFKMKLLIQLPTWIHRINKNLIRSKARDKIIKDFMEMHTKCRKKNLDPIQVRQQCKDLFMDYDF